MKFKSRYMLCELWRYQCVICEGKGDLQIYKVIRAPHILFLSTSNVSDDMACVRECVDGNSTVLSIYDHHHYQPDHRLDDDDHRLDDGQPEEGVGVEVARAHHDHVHLRCASVFKRRNLQIIIRMVGWLLLSLTEATFRL